MRSLKGLLALAMVAIAAVGCGEDSKTTTTTTTDTTSDTTPSDTADVAGDVTTTTDVAGDATATAGGCSGDADKAFRAMISGDQGKTTTFANDLKNCTLAKGCLGKPTDSEKIACIGACVKDIYGKDGLTTSCSNCYGLTGWCGAAKCLAQCAADPTSQACTDCRNTNCKPIEDACNAGTCDPLGDKHCGQ
jgi:hypothetical protein